MEPTIEKSRFPCGNDFDKSRGIIAFCGSSIEVSECRYFFFVKLGILYRRILSPGELSKFKLDGRLSVASR